MARMSEPSGSPRRDRRRVEWRRGCLFSSVSSSRTINRQDAQNRRQSLRKSGVLPSLDNPYVFPGAKPGKPLSNMTFLKASRRVTTTPLTTHGFRSSFRDWCEERTNVSRTVSEAALAHVVRDKTEAAYRRTVLFDKRRDLMDRWAQFATSTPANIVSIGA